MNRHSPAWYSLHERRLHNFSIHASWITALQHLHPVLIRPCVATAQAILTHQADKQHYLSKRWGMVRPNNAAG